MLVKSKNRQLKETLQSSILHETHIHFVHSTTACIATQKCHWSGKHLTKGSYAYLNNRKNNLSWLNFEALNSTWRLLCHTLFNENVKFLPVDTNRQKILLIQFCKRNLPISWLQRPALSIFNTSSASIALKILLPYLRS